MLICTNACTFTCIHMHRQVHLHVRRIPDQWRKCRMCVWRVGHLARTARSRSEKLSLSLSLNAQITNEHPKCPIVPICPDPSDLTGVFTYPISPKMSVRCVLGFSVCHLESRSSCSSNFTILRTLLVSEFFDVAEMTQGSPGWFALPHRSGVWYRNNFPSLFACDFYFSSGKSPKIAKNKRK